MLAEPGQLPEQNAVIHHSLSPARRLFLPSDSNLLQSNQASFPQGREKDAEEKGVRNHFNDEQR
ncbi:MAG: hypothetical protein OJF50_005387 [Nitrospira sp.]|jgi:hypothetical protein|nr:hypothetical protein [Nitrospira sp.]